MVRLISTVLSSGRRLRRALAIVGVVAAVLTVAVRFVQPHTTPRTSPDHLEAHDVATARADLTLLETKGRAPKTGYSRSEFGLGHGWPTTRRGCDTRDEILARDLVDVPAHTGCNINAGTLHDPYSGRTITLTSQTPKAIEIEHLVALADAWQKGAQQWTPDQRGRFATDPDNLLAVDGPTNSAKHDADAATWLPPNKRFRCAYAVGQIRIKTRYRLWTTAAEKTALARLLDTCPPSTDRMTTGPHVGGEPAGRASSFGLSPWSCSWAGSDDCADRDGCGDARPTTRRVVSSWWWLR